MSFKSWVKPFVPKAVRRLAYDLSNNVAIPVAQRQIYALRQGSASPFLRKPRPGYSRGIDFYSAQELPKVLATCYGMYYRTHGRFPNILNARGFNEKCIRSKFLAELKIPQSGNKLLTSSFIPAEIADRLKTPAIVWHSPQPKLPSNDHIRPGEYYLKASHGSGMYRKIRYPLSAEERRELEALCEAWLHFAYGLDDGEWWYSAFTPEVLIEQQVGFGDTSITWNVHTFADRIGFISGYRKVTPLSSPLDESLWLDGEFQPLPFQNKSKRRPQGSLISKSTQDRMLEFASIIGRQFKFVRVDFLTDQDENLYLGEMTFNPMNGLNTSRHKDFDLWLGSLWDQSSF